MKRIHPSVFDILISKMSSQNMLLHTFKKKWGTEVVDGIEVMKARHVVYPNPSQETLDLLKYLGQMSLLDNDTSGIDSWWLRLNASKAGDAEIDWDGTSLAVSINEELEKSKIPDVLEYDENGKAVYAYDVIGKVSIMPKVNSKLDMTAVPVTASPADQQALIAEIFANRNTWFNEDYQFDVTSSNDVLYLFWIYRFLTLTTPAAIEAVQEKIESRVITVRGKPKYISYTYWEVTLRERLPAIAGNSPLVERIKTAVANNQTLNEQRTSRMVGSPIEGTSFNGMGTNNTSSFWYKGQLRADYFSNPAVPKEERIKYIHSAIDSDYKKEKVPWYKYVFVAVIAIGAFILSGPAGASAATAIGLTSGTVMFTIVAVSVALVTAAAIMSVITVAFSLSGDTGTASVLASFQKSIAPIVRIAQVIALVTVIYGAVRRGLDEAAKRAAEREAASQAASTGASLALGDIAVGVGSELGEVYVSQTYGLDISRGLTFENSSKLLNLAMNEQQQRENRKVANALKHSQKELDELREAQEGLITSDVLKSLASIQPQILNQDMSEYSELYDRPYEWWSTPYHTGCSQANTVGGLWLSKT